MKPKNDYATLKDDYAKLKVEMAKVRGILVCILHIYLVPNFFFLPY